MKKLVLLGILCLLMIFQVVSGMSLTSNVTTGSTIFTGDVILLSATNNWYACTMKTSTACDLYGGPVPGFTGGSTQGFTNVPWTVPSEFVSGYLKYVDSVHGEMSNCIYYTKSNGIRVVASFTINATSGVAPIVIRLNDTSTGIPTSWYWVVSSDSYTTSSTVQNPIFTILDPGIYTVSLITSNIDSNDTEIKNDYITVSSPSTPSTKSMEIIGGMNILYFTVIATFLVIVIYLISLFTIKEE